MKVRYGRGSIVNQHFIHNVAPAFGTTRQFIGANVAPVHNDEAAFSKLESEVQRLKSGIEAFDGDAIGKMVAEAVRPVAAQIAAAQKRQHVEDGGRLNISNPFSGKVETEGPSDWSDFSVNAHIVREVA